MIIMKQAEAFESFSLFFCVLLYSVTTANYDGLLAIEGILLYTLYSRKIVLWQIMW